MRIWMHWENTIQEEGSSGRATIFPLSLSLTHSLLFGDLLRVQYNEAN
jgi:hypothetical protein